MKSIQGSKSRLPRGAGFLHNYYVLKLLIQAHSFLSGIYNTFLPFIVVGVRSLPVEVTKAVTHDHTNILCSIPSLKTSSAHGPES